MAAFTWIDIVVGVVILSSSLLSVLRGLVKEIASLAIWVLAVVAASRLSHFVADLFPQWLSPPLQQTAGFLVILVVVLIVGKLVTLALKELVQAAGIGVIDRVLGLAFGFLRGALIVVVLAILASLTSLPKEAAWQKAKTRVFLEYGIRMAAPWLPDAIQQNMKVPSQSGLPDNQHSAQRPLTCAA